MIDIVTLSKRTSWYGQWSGYYEQLPLHFSRIGLVQKIIRPKLGLMPRVLGKLVALGWGTPPRDQSLTWAEHQFYRCWRTKGTRLGFVTSIETHLPLVNRWPNPPRNVVAAIHFPPVHWTEEMRRSLRSLSSALVLYSRDLDFFEEHVGRGRVKFVHHGVDTNFFTPAAKGQRGDVAPKVLVVGQFDRDFELIGELARSLQGESPVIELDLVIAAHASRIPGVAALIGMSNVCVHSGVSDAALRDLYRGARVLLLPMKSSGANNAIVEALACGLPVVTNDAGGIRDYGGGTAFPLPGGPQELRDLLFHYLTDKKASDEAGARCREFAEQYLSWPRVATQHWSTMQELAGRTQ